MAEHEFDVDGAIEKWLEGKKNQLLIDRPTTSTSTSTSVKTGTTISHRASITEQISRRFFDVPTPEKFLDSFEISFGGFLENMRDTGLGSGDIGLALDPATGLMDRLMAEYMGDLAQRAERGEDIFEIVGTEEDFNLLRTEPGMESSTKGTSEETSQSQSGGTTTGQSGKKGPQTGAQAAQEQRGGPGAPPTVTSTSTGKSGSTSKQTSKGTFESKFSEVVEVLSRPEISAVFKFSPGDFLSERFHGDAGELATFIQSEKGVRQRQRQTLAGGVVVAGRQT